MSARICLSSLFLPSNIQNCWKACTWHRSHVLHFSTLTSANALEVSQLTTFVAPVVLRLAQLIICHDLVLCNGNRVYPTKVAESASFRPHVLLKFLSVFLLIRSELDSSNWLHELPQSLDSFFIIPSYAQCLLQGKSCSFNKSLTKFKWCWTLHQLAPDSIIPECTEAAENCRTALVTCTFVLLLYPCWS